MLDIGGDGRSVSRDGTDRWKMLELQITLVSTPSTTGEAGNTSGTSGSSGTLTMVVGCGFIHAQGLGSNLGLRTRMKWS